MSKLRYLLISLWFRLGGWPVIVDLGGIRFRLRKQHYQLRALLRGGNEAFLENLALMASEEAIFIDVGANVGIASLVMARRVQKVVAFEPTPDSFDDFKFNMRLNKSLNISSLPAALSSRSGVMAMRAEPWWGHNSLISSQDQSMGKPVVYVPVLPLDSLLGLIAEDGLEFMSRQPVLIKIDVEGHEIEVIKGGHNLLSKLDNVVICFESWGQSYSEPCIKYLEKLGYQIFSPPIDTNGMDVFMKKKTA